MGLAAQISAEMKLFMQEWGFRKRGNFFFKIKNDLAFCVYLEQPTGLVYSGFCVMPLYLPAESRYLTYGDRLNAFSPCPVGPLPVDGDAAQWAEQLRFALAEYIFPFFDSIANPQALDLFLNEKNKKIRTYFFCPDLDLYRLRLYTKRYLRQWDELSSLLAKSEAVLQKSPHVQGPIADQFRRECTALAQSAVHPADAKAGLETIISGTKSALFHL